MQVQMNAPVQVLLGTDLQPSLGFRLVDLEDLETAQNGNPKVDQQDPEQVHRQPWRSLPKMIPRQTLQLQFIYSKW